MTRRAFLASLPFVPAAVKAVVAAPARPKCWTIELERPPRHLIIKNFSTPYPGYRCNATGIKHALDDFEESGGQQPIDMEFLQQMPPFRCVITPVTRIMKLRSLNTVVREHRHRII